MFRVWGDALLKHTLTHHLPSRHSKSAHTTYSTSKCATTTTTINSGLVFECMSVFVCTCGAHARTQVGRIPDRAKWFNQNIYILELHVRRIACSINCIISSNARLASCYKSSRISCQTFRPAVDVFRHAHAHTLSSPRIRSERRPL